MLLNYYKLEYLSLAHTCNCSLLHHHDHLLVFINIELHCWIHSVLLRYNIIRVYYFVLSSLKNISISNITYFYILVNTYAIYQNIITFHKILYCEVLNFLFLNLLKFLSYYFMSNLCLSIIEKRQIFKFQINFKSCPNKY